MSQGQRLTCLEQWFVAVAQLETDTRLGRWGKGLFLSVFLFREELSGGRRSGPVGMGLFARVRRSSPIRWWWGGRQANDALESLSGGEWPQSPI